MITVVGSFIADFITRAPRMPKAGETLLGGPFTLGPGGKGGNQAVAASRCGSSVTMVTKVGQDAFSQLAFDSFTKEGIVTDYITTHPTVSTGAALILVEENTGENCIVVALGAAGCITREDVLAAEPAIAHSQILLVQLETSDEAVKTAVELAQQHGVTVLLNPAPYRPLSPALLQGATYITPNETEAAALSGIPLNDDDSLFKAAEAIRQKGPRSVLLTLGKRGCLVYRGPENYTFVPAFSVPQVVDTTGAGDAFSGGLAHALSRGVSLEEAARFGCAVAALSVTRAGTTESLPSRQEICAFLAAQGETSLLERI